MSDSRRFAFRLALSLGIPNPDVLLANIPHRIFREWQAYWIEEPFGPEVEGLRIGYAAAALGNLLGKPKGKKAWAPDDFMPTFRRRESTPDDLFRKMKAITTTMGGRVIDKRSKLGTND